MKKIEATIRPEVLTKVQQAIAETGLSIVINCSPTVRLAQNETTAAPKFEGFRGLCQSFIIWALGGSNGPLSKGANEKARLDLIVSDDDVEAVAEAIVRSANTGNIGDGMVVILEVSGATKIRTGEEGEAAIYSVNRGS